MKPGDIPQYYVTPGWHVWRMGGRRITTEPLSQLDAYVLVERLNYEVRK